MKFSIQIISKKPKKIWGLLSYEGQIIIGDFQEKFVMPLNSWNIEQYKQQWQEGIKRIKTKPVSCLVATVQNLYTHPLIEMWILYKENNTIYFQNNLLNNSIIAEDPALKGLDLANFTPETCYQYIDYHRKTHTEDGTKISEWSLPVENINSNIMS